MYPIKLKAGDRNINIVRLNYDGDLLFSGGPGDQQNPCVNVFSSFTGEHMGSFVTKASIKSLDVDMDSKYLICASFDGTIQMFDVMTGESMFWAYFAGCKGYHLQFALGSKKFLFLHDFQMNSELKIIDYPSFTSLKPNEEGKVEVEKRNILNNFSVYYEQGVKCRCEKAKWFADNSSIFLGTNNGEIVHFSEQGKQINKGLIHKDGKIKGLAFSQDFSILVTAGSDGCKIVNPTTMEIMRFFKQQFPVNDVAVSPLFCHQLNPKYHIITGGGIPAIQAAESKGAGFEVHVCNVMDGIQLGKISTNFGPINSIQFLKDGKGYVTGSEDSFVTIVRFDQPYFDTDKYE